MHCNGVKFLLKSYVYFYALMIPQGLGFFINITWVKVSFFVQCTKMQLITFQNLR